jgi:hypothetical protein
MDEIIGRCLDALDAARRKYDPVSAEVQRDVDELLAILKELELPRQRKRWPTQLKSRLYHQQDGYCGCNCGERLPPPGETGAHVDHVFPWAKGGQNGLDNLQLLRAKCNLAKGARCDVDDVIRLVEDKLLNLLPLEVIAQVKTKTTQDNT